MARDGGNRRGSLFRQVNKSGRVGNKLSAHSMRVIIKRHAKKAGLRGRFSGHSPRVGTAQSLRRHGAESPELMAAGRWERPETMALYTRIQDAALGPVARYRYGASPPAQGVVLERLAELESLVTGVLTEVKHVHRKLTFACKKPTPMAGAEKPAKAACGRHGARVRFH